LPNPMYGGIQYHISTSVPIHAASLLSMHRRCCGTPTCFGEAARVACRHNKAGALQECKQAQRGAVLAEVQAGTATGGNAEVQAGTSSKGDAEVRAGTTAWEHRTGSHTTVGATSHGHDHDQAPLPAAAHLQACPEAREAGNICRGLEHRLGGAAAGVGAAPAVLVEPLQLRPWAGGGRCPYSPVQLPSRDVAPPRCNQ
jgi:hypothetical protein